MLEETQVIQERQKIIITTRKKENKKQNIKNKQPKSLQQINLEDFESKFIFLLETVCTI